MSELDKAAVKAGIKNAKKYNKQKRRASNRNSYVVAVRYALSALGFAWVMLNGILDARSNNGDPAAALLPALIAFLFVWFVLGFAERAISSAIAKQAEEVRIAAQAAAIAAQAEE
jgi:hypothetical protein